MWLHLQPSFPDSSAKVQKAQELDLEDQLKSDLNARFDFTAMLLIVVESAPSLTIKHYVKVCCTKRLSKQNNNEENQSVSKPNMSLEKKFSKMARDGAHINSFPCFAHP